jgi:hypothetical protein
MPEQYRRPHNHERIQTVERMKHAWEAERNALATVRRFNAVLSAKGYAWFWPKIAAAITAKHPWLVILCESCGCVTDLDLRVKPARSFNQRCLARRALPAVMGTGDHALLRWRRIRRFRGPVSANCSREL